MAIPSLQLQHGLTFEATTLQYQLSKIAPLTTATERHSQPPLSPPARPPATSH